MQMIFRPLTSWPCERTRRRKSRYHFKATWSKTIELLDRELGFVKADNVVVQAAVESDQIHIDGMLRSGASPSWPGVIISFDCRKGSLSFPCDAYELWQHNVRAIALSLEALRAVDRHGVTRRAEQYKGWDRIGHKVNGGMPADRAAQTLAELFAANAGEILRHEDYYRRTMRRALASSHPDAGGKVEVFKQLGRIKEALDAYHGA